MALLDRFARIVRCDAGHYYRTVWVPGLSLKALVRWGDRRYQWCPVGRHGAGVTRLAADQVARLTDLERAEADGHTDGRVP